MFVKNFLSKFRTLLVVLLIIAGAAGLLELIGAIGGYAKNNDGIGGTIIFAILGFGFIAVIIYFLIGKGQTVNNEKDMAKQGLLKEKMYNEIKKKPFLPGSLCHTLPWL